MKGAQRVMVEIVDVRRDRVLRVCHEMFIGSLTGRTYAEVRANANMAAIANVKARCERSGEFSGRELAYRVKRY